jgi:hypothetical protein
VIAWSKKPSDVWQVLNFLAVYIAAVTDTLRPRSCCPANHGTWRGPGAFPLKDVHALTQSFEGLARK